MKFERISVSVSGGAIVSLPAPASMRLRGKLFPKPVNVEAAPIDQPAAKEQNASRRKLFSAAPGIIADFICAHPETEFTTAALYSDESLRLLLGMKMSETRFHEYLCRIEQTGRIARRIAITEEHNGHARRAYWRAGAAK